MRRKVRMSLIGVVGIVILVPAFLSHVFAEHPSVDSVSGVQVEIARIMGSQPVSRVGVKDTAGRLLDLLGTYSSPEDKGRIYYQAALAYAFGGPAFADQAIQLARTALEYPQGLHQRAELNFLLGDSIAAAERGKSTRDEIRRRESLEFYLTALSTYVSMQRPISLEDRRKTGRIERYPPGMTEAEKEESNRTQLALIRAIREQEDLGRKRHNVIEQTADLLADAPDPEAEIRRSAEGILEDEAAIAETIHLTKAVATQPGLARAGLRQWAAQTQPVKQ